ILSVFPCILRSLYGVNSERIHGAPFWPPLNSSGMNLKTLPCSTERYSYKFEGQPSALTVFQPEVIKRSNRNQPAPQLSRILRPRRFVCRKCKKAYHVEENGIEMSSTALSLQIERSTQDGVKAMSDSEAVQVPSPNAAASKVLRGNRPKLSVDDDSGQMQSIRRVAPSIIPKLNDDYGLSGRESEADSNSDDAIVVRRSKLGSVEQTSHDDPSVPTTKTIIPTKRKAEFVCKPSRSKKVKRATVDRTLLTVSIPSTANAMKACDSVEPTAISATDQDVSINSSGSLVTINLKPQSTLQCTENPSAPQKVDEHLVRKNRIKAQYVSVATPFRFPPSRSSKPNLFANNPFGAGIKERSVAPKRVRSTESSPKKSKSDTNTSSPVNSRKANLPGACEPSASKKTDSSSMRSRTRGRSAQSLPSNTATNHTSPNCSAGSSASIPPNPSEHPPSGDVASELHPTDSTTLMKCDATTDSVSATNPFAQSKVIPPSALFSQDSGPASTPSANPLDGGSCRSRSIDYEKPKNRWIREARARRSQEERAPGLTVANLSVSTTSLPASSCPDTASFSNGLSSPTLSRLRVRSGDGGISCLSPSANVSPKTPSSIKKRTNTIGSSNQDGNSALPDEVMKSFPTATACSPRGAPTGSDASSASLPVLKIKINRQRQPSCSSSTNAQYEVVELQVPDIEQTNLPKVHLQDAVCTTTCGVASHISTNNMESKPTESCNGSPAADVASPTLSAGSSHKEVSSVEAPGLGRLVKRCKLPDGVVFRIGDLVWSKLSGWPYWPAQITSIHQSVLDEQEVSSDVALQPGAKAVSYTACLHWFAWHQVSYMTCDKLYHFMQHYKRFDNKRKRGVFRQAVNEARQAADKKRDEVPSSSDPDSAEENETADSPSRNPTWNILASQCSPELSNGQNILSHESTAAEMKKSDVDVVPLKNQSPPSHDVAPTTVADISLLVESSTLPYKPLTKGHPSSGRVRRGAPRGRARAIRGRRGGLCGSSGSGQVSLRSSASFLSPSQNDEKTPYDQFDEMDAIQAPVPFRRKNALSARGRGALSKIGENADHTVDHSRAKGNPLETTLPPLVSTGSLKIKLSTAHLRLPVVKKRRSTKPKVSRRRTNSTPEVWNSVVSTRSIPVSTQSVSSAVSSTSDNVAPNPDQLPAIFPPTYEEPSQAILSQFPHVFSDLRPGTLSDAVEIPTFSEDESEEENTGRLIIDPEVVAAVNVSNALPTVAHQDSLSRGRSENPMLGEVLYNSSCFNSLPESTAPIRSDMDPLFTHAIPNLMDPPQCRPRETIFGFKPHSSSSSAPTIAAPRYNHTSLTSSPTGVATVSAMLPFSGSPGEDLPCLPRPNAFDLFDPASNPRTSYFRPSSHMGVPPVTTPSAVPYITSNFPTR
ncbi:hypothetical protein FBUS_11329, partial [Fasciolopsis buskii]